MVEGDQKITDKGADHEDLAVGKVDEPQDAVNHRVTHGQKAQNASVGEGVDKLLSQIQSHSVHSLLRPVFPPTRSPDTTPSHIHCPEALGLDRSAGSPPFQERTPGSIRRAPNPRFVPPIGWLPLRR